MDRLALSDYDGTYDEHPELHGFVNAIVTGTSWTDYRDFMDTKVGPDVPVFFNPTDKVDFLSIINHKSGIINKTGATDFYENQKNQVDILKVLCPNCKIHLVEEGRTYI